MINYKTIFFLFILMTSWSIAFGQSSNDRATIKRLLSIRYIPNGQETNEYAVNENGESGEFWEDSGIDALQEMMKALLFDASNGGDMEFQKYIAETLKITNKPIIVFLWKDNISLSRNKYKAILKPCISNFGTTNNPKLAVWPCASSYDVEYDNENTWGGYAHIGNTYGHEKGISSLKATFIHELTHTQDDSSPLNEQFRVNNHNYRYGRDGKHYYTEAVPNKRMAYKEAIANVLGILYDDKVFDKFLVWFGSNGYLGVEAIAPSGFSTEARNRLGLSEDIWLYDQIKDAVGHPGIRKSINSTVYYKYHIQELPPRFIVHNEIITAMAIALSSNYIQGFDPFIYGVKGVNRILENEPSKDPLALLINWMAYGVLKQRDIQSSGIPSQRIEGEKHYEILPLAFFDYFTAYKSQTINEYSHMFNDELDLDLLNLYWNHFKDDVRSVEIAPIQSIEGDTRPFINRFRDHLWAVSNACGIPVMSRLDNAEDFNFEASESMANKSSNIDCNTNSDGCLSVLANELIIEVVKVAVTEQNYWKSNSLTERKTEAENKLIEYWLATQGTEGTKDKIDNSEAWSATFISYLFLKAYINLSTEKCNSIKVSNTNILYGDFEKLNQSEKVKTLRHVRSCIKASGLFSPAQKHVAYIYNSMELENNSIQLYDPTTESVQIGDLVLDRANGQDVSITADGKISRKYGHSHADLVVEIITIEGAKFAKLVGGNTSKSSDKVAFKLRPLSTDGKLIQTPLLRVSTEDMSQSLKDKMENISGSYYHSPLNNDDKYEQVKIAPTAIIARYQ